MPGLFGGGSDQTTGAPLNVNIKAKAPEWANTMHDYFTPSGAPGGPGQLSQIGMLANQMAGGGFGNQTDNAAWLNRFYKPAPTAYFGAPISPTAAPKVKPKPKTPVVDQSVMVDGKLKRRDQVSFGRNGR